MPSEAQTTDGSNKPLVEAIAEIRWRLHEVPPGSGEFTDPGFQLLPGAMAEFTRTEYPTFVSLPSAQVPDAFLPSVVRYQFRRGPNAWPVIQLGPGIATLNSTADYRWREFSPRLTGLLEELHKRYPSHIHPFEISGLDLRFLNAFPLDAGAPVLEWLRTRFNVNIDLPIAPKRQDDESQADCGLTLFFSSQRSYLPGRASLRLSLGKRGDEPAVIVELLAQGRNDDIPSTATTVSAWFDRAHELLKEWFVSLNP